MTRISIDLPDELIASVGSESAAQELILSAAATELLRRGLISSTTAEEWIGDSLQDWQRLGLNSGAFDFWKAVQEDVYTENDGEPL